MLVTGTWTGQDAADLRAAYRMPITEFAVKLGIGERTISQWESKGTGLVPTPGMQQVLDAALHLAPDPVKDRFALLCAQRHAGTAGSAADDDVMSDLNRRELLRLLAITGVAVGTTGQLDAERLGSPGADTGPALLAEYGKVNARLWQVYAQAAPKRAVLPFVNSHLTVITRRLRDAGGDARKRLCSLTAELFQLAGEIFFDGNRYTDAAHCYTLAADAAREAGAADLWSCAMTRHSFVYVYGRDFRAAVPMLDAAAAIARNGDRSLPAWQWASCVRAQALAGTGNLAGCEEALDDAATVDELSSPGNGGWLRFDGTRLPEERGGCYTMLGKPAKAAACLESALTGRLSARRRGSVRTDLAACALQRRDLDEFAGHVAAALEVAGETGSGYVARRLRGLQPGLAAFSADTRVRDFNDRINALEAAS
jgi:transcriptional regulator with XRE-family HTH domain